MCSVESFLCMYKSCGDIQQQKWKKRFWIGVGAEGKLEDFDLESKLNQESLKMALKVDGVFRSFGEILARDHKPPESGKYSLQEEIIRCDRGDSNGLTSVVLKNAVKILVGKELDLENLSKEDLKCILAITRNFFLNDMLLIPDFETSKVKELLGEIEEAGTLTEGDFNVIVEDLRRDCPQSFLIIYAVLSLKTDLNITRLPQIMAALLERNFISPQLIRE